MDPDAPNYVVKVLERDSAILDATVLVDNTSLQRGFHCSGPNPGLVTVDKNKFQISLDGDGFQEITLNLESRFHRSGPNPGSPTADNNKFLISLDGATAADIETLGETVRARVKEKSGIELEWEIKRIGVSA